jgi:hypothetical protein
MPAVLKALTDPEERVRTAVKQFLIEKMSKTIITKLVRMYAQSPSNSDLRKTIREVIEDTGDRTGLAYIQALDQPTAYVQQQILVSLEGKKKVLPDLLKDDKKDNM